MKKIYFLILAVSLGIISCKKDFPIPKQPAEIYPGLFLNAALMSTAFNNATNYIGLTRWMGYWAEGKNFPADLQTETYDIKNNYTDKEWNNLYQNLAIYDDLEKSGRNNKNPFYIGVAKAMKAYDFSILVDLYNDVPYKESFDPATKKQPVYSKGQDIYNDLVNQLDSAFIYFENAKIFYDQSPSNVANTDDVNDIMFGLSRRKNGGNSAWLILWEKFTNTLELKLLMHQTNIASHQSYFQNSMNILTTSPNRKSVGFLGVGESAAVNPGYCLACASANPLNNPLYNFFIYPDTNFYYYKANNYALNFLHWNNNDQRAGVLYNDASYFDNFINSWPGIDTFYASGGGANFDYIITVGIYDGDPTGFPDSITSNVGPGILKNSGQSQLILSDFESLFLQAEAVERGYIQGGNSSAQTLYNSAVTQNYVYLYGGLPKSFQDAFPDPYSDSKGYLTSSIPDVDWRFSPNKLEAIMTQKWAAMNGVNWVEAYNDYRRTAYPTSNVLGISHAPAHVRPMIPTRFLYPQSQLDNNGSHVPPLPDGQYSKVFWNQ